MITCTISEELEELRADLEIKERIYPRWIIEDRINRETAQRRLKALKSTISRLEREEKNKTGEQLTLI